MACWAMHTSLMCLVVEAMETEAAQAAQRQGLGHRIGESSRLPRCCETGCRSRPLGQADGATAAASGIAARAPGVVERRPGDEGR